MLRFARVSAHSAFHPLFFFLEIFALKTCLRFLRPLVKRGWHYLALHLLAADFHKNFMPDLCVRWRHIGQRNILFHEWRRRSAGNYADLMIVLVEDLVSIAWNTAIDCFQPDQDALQPFGFV